MFNTFLIFLSGAITMKILQLLLGIMPNFYIFKEAERTTLMILTDLHVRRLTALKIIELSYEEAGVSEEFLKVKSAINEKYDILINKCIENMKSKLPYKVQYTTLHEAVTLFIQREKEKTNE